MSGVERAFIEPIKTVILVDDQFDTYDGPSAVEADGEVARGRRLWRAFVDAGVSCDVANQSKWSGGDVERRLANSDLIILDYELTPGSADASLQVVRELAHNTHPNLVVIYTATGEALQRVILRAALAIRGWVPHVDAAADDILIQNDVASVEPPLEALRSAALGDLDAALKDLEEQIGGLEDIEIDEGMLSAVAQRLLDGHLLGRLGAPQATAHTGVYISRSNAPVQWCQGGNVFVVAIAKAEVGIDAADERILLMDALANALRDWSPPALRTALAYARHLVRDIGYQGDQLGLPNGLVRAALWFYANESSDDAVRRERTHEIWDALMDGVTAAVSQRMAAFLETITVHATGAWPVNQINAIEKACEIAGYEVPARPLEVLHAVNTFLSTQAVPRDYVRVGTVFRRQGADAWWLCATPACDLVPREPSKAVYPWLNEAHPFRPMMTIRLVRKLDHLDNKSLKDAQTGRFIFMRRGSETWTFETTDRNGIPKIEMMFSERAGVVEDNTFMAQVLKEVDPDNPTLALEAVEFEVVGQLRKGYAERLLHGVGYHLSRVGVDFIKRR